MVEKWGKTLTRVIRLALPAIFENLMLTLVNIVDVAMVGSLGAEATAAAALNAQPLWFANATMMLVAGGAMVLTARCVGSHDSGRAGLYVRHGVVLSCFVGALLTAAAWLSADGYAALMHAAPDVAPDAAAYMRIVGSSMVFMALGRTLACVIQGAGDTMTPMKISLFANFCNVAGNYVLIYRPHALSLFGRTFFVWGAGWGVRGAAVSTAASMVLSSLLLIAALARRNDGLKLHLRDLTNFHMARARDLLVIGGPIAAERIVLSTGQMFYMGIISTLGTLSISAHYLAVTVEGVCYNPAFGVSVAATALVGQSLGAGDEASATRNGRISIVFCFAVMAVVSALMYCFAAPLVGMFSADERIVAQGAMALRIVAWAEPFLGVALTAAGALRGAGDTVFPLWLGIFTMYVVRLVSARIFVLRMGLELAGAWYAMVLDMALRGLTLWLYFLSGRWKARSRRLSARTGL
ncbi:MAG: MATE family efflux transporter [Pyramidobacter sp.]|jgi:putative MATE family efflux protein